jgi:hypothetical protein
MKLLIVTAVEQFHTEVLQLLKEAKIESFSGSNIDGYKNIESLMITNSWFPGQSGGTESSMFFSFTDENN